METTRSRFGSILEWLIAAAFMVAAFALMAVAVPGLRGVRALTTTPVLATEAPAPDVTATVPPRAVSVPLLLFGDGRQIRIGDRVSDIVSRLGGDAQVGGDAVERVAGRDRLTRLYNYVGTRFALVFETVDGSSEPRVVGIYKE